GAPLLLVRGQGRGQLGSGEALHACLDLEVAARRGVEGPPGLARALDEIALRSRQPLALGVAERDRLEHRLLGDLAGARLHHQHCLLGRGDDALEGRFLLLRGRGVRDQLAVDQADPHGADGPVERDARQTERRRGAVDRQDVRIVLLITGDHEADHLHFVAEPVGEEWSDRPIDQTRGQRLLLDRRTFSLEVAAGDASAGVCPLTVLYGERETVLRVLRAFGSHASGQDHRAAVPDDDGAVGLLGHLARFDGHALAVDLDFYSVRHTKIVLAYQPESGERSLERAVNLPARGPPEPFRPRTDQ